MNRSTEHLRLSLALALGLALSACAGLDRKGTPEPTSDTETETAPEVVKTPEERYAEAVALLETNQFSDAQQAFEALSQEVPEKSGPWTNLGLIHQRANRKAEARQAFATAVRLNPDNATAQNQLGILLREGGDYAGARQAYEAALAARPDFAEAHLNLGLLLDNHLAGSDRAALEHYRRYLSLNGSEDLRVQVWIAEIEQALSADDARDDEGTP
jgi:Tfp pilus assembly protein PilF